MQAVDQFLADQIRTLAKSINDQRRQEQDDKALDKVHEENRKLDQFKNRFLPIEGTDGHVGKGANGNGPGGPPPPPPLPTGTIPETIEFAWTGDMMRTGRAVQLHLTHILQPSVRDNEGRVVPRVGIEWHTSDSRIFEFVTGDLALGRRKGKATIWVRIKGTAIESRRIEVEVWTIDHVLLTPRALQIPLGKRKQIIAEVTNDDGVRATDVYLNWEHDADDQLIVRIQPSGWVTGNRIGRTTVTAGAGGAGADGVWARIRPEIEVVPNPEKLERGGSYPQLLLTDKDIDPSTGQKREGDPGQPALWQEVEDQINNIWWLNLGSPDAAFAFGKSIDDEKLWRMFHAQKVVEMAIQVYMQQEFTKKEEQRPDVWVNHKAAWERHQIMIAPAMWEVLQTYVNTGGGLE